MDRRTSLKLFALAPLPLVAGCGLSTEEAAHVHRRVGAARTGAADTLPPFLNDHERETVRILVDLILPADERSGSASEAGVVEFIDFTAADRSYVQVPLRGGLAWLDVHTRRRHGRAFKDATDAQRRSVLDEIAYPDDVAPGLQHGASFFTFLRDLTASGYWSSREGMADLGYMGNTAVAQWTGAPQAEMDRLGLSFDAWETA